MIPRHSAISTLIFRTLSVANPSKDWFCFKGIKEIQGISPGSFLAGFPPSKFHVAITFGIPGRLYALYTRYATPLRKIPGPILASITKL